MERGWCSHGADSTEATTAFGSPCLQWGTWSPAPTWTALGKHLTSLCRACSWTGHCGGPVLPASPALPSCWHRSTPRISCESVPCLLSLSLLCSWVSQAAPQLCIPNLLSCTGSVWHTQCLRACQGTALLSSAQTLGSAQLSPRSCGAMGYAWLRPEGPHVLRMVWLLPGTCRCRRCQR